METTKSYILTTISKTCGEKCYFDGRGFSLRPENAAIYAPISYAKYRAKLVADEFAHHIDVIEAH